MSIHLNNRTKPEPLEAERISPEVKRYQRQKLTTSIVSMCVAYFYLAFFAIQIGPSLQAPLQSMLGDSRWMQLIVVAALLGVGIELLTFPFAFYSGYVLQHRYGLSNQSLGKWVWKNIKSYLVGGMIGLPLLLGLYALIWYGGTWWWVWAAIGYLAVTLLLGRIAPILILPLFYKVKRLDNPELLSRLKRIAQGTGLSIEGIYQLGLSEETKKANAALTGLGKSRRVLLGDTLLEEFSPEEIEVVFAHEIGHHVHRHLPKMVLLSVLTTSAGCWLVDLLLRTGAPRLGYAAFDVPAALPLVLLVLTTLSLLLAPLNNALSRFYERQCDRYALDRTGLHVAYRSAFLKLAKLNKSDPDPMPIVVWLFYDHPPIRQRLAMADK